MGERKGTNKYYPPDFDPQKHKSLAGYTGQHPLRERARKLGKGILIIRFEMPYNIWCGGCNNHIGMGVRYNAEKSKVGNYYTTPIWKFRMKCHLCDNHFEIQTDPANHDYVILSGARRKEQRWDPKENEQIVPEDKATQKKLALDPMYNLEHGVNDKVKMQKSSPSIATLQDLYSQWKDDDMLNKLARNKFREEKKLLQKAKERDMALLSKLSIDVDLLDELPQDIKMAKLLQLSSTKSFDDTQKDKRKEIENKSVFSFEKSSCGSMAGKVNQIEKARKSLGIRLSGVKSSTSSSINESEKSSQNLTVLAHTGLHPISNSPIQNKTVKDATEDPGVVNRDILLDESTTKSVSSFGNSIKTNYSGNNKNSVQSSGLNIVAYSNDSSSSFEDDC